MSIIAHLLEISNTLPQSTQTRQLPDQRFWTRKAAFIIFMALEFMQVINHLRIVY